MFSTILGGCLIILWGILHVLIIPLVSNELRNKDVDSGLSSLITLSYLGIVVMILTNGLIVIFTAIYGIRKGEGWAVWIEISQGILFSFVTILLISLQPKISIMGFSEEFVLILAIITDLSIAVLILIPLVLWHKELK